MKKRIAACLGTALGLVVTPARGEIADRVAAVVNGEVILSSEVDEALTQVGPLPTAAEDLRSLRQEAVDTLIGRRLVNQEMERSDTQVTEADLQRIVSSIAKANRMTEDQLRDAVEREGYTWQQFLDDQRERQRYAMFLRSEIGSRITVPEDEIRALYDKKAAEAPQDPRLHLWMILLPVDATTGESSALAQARELKARIEGGTPFADVARSHSKLPNAASGGDSGFVSLVDLNPTFRDVIRGLPESGGVAEPFATPQGVWMLAVSERRQSAVAPYEELKPALYEELIQERQEAALSAWVVEARRDAFVQVLWPASETSSSPAPTAP